MRKRLDRHSAFIIVFGLLLLAAILIGIPAANGQGETIFEIVFSRLNVDEQGPDEVFTLPEYGLVCVFKDGSLDCECPCTDGECAENRVEEAGEIVVETTPEESTTPVPGTTPTKPAPTSTVPAPTATTPAPSPTSPVPNPTATKPAPNPTDTPPPAPSPTAPPPVPTDVSPTAIPEFDGVWITHYDGKGNEVWTKCMPPSAVNGHRPDHSSHRGHPIPDVIGGGCYR